MSFRQFIIDRVRLFFMLTTLISVAMYVLGSAFDADARLGYDAYLSPLIYASACIVPTVVTYSRRELTMRELLLRMVLELLLMEVVVLGIVAASSPLIPIHEPFVWMSLSVSVLVIYVTATFLEWVGEYAEARRMNEALARLQNQSGGSN